MAFDRNSAKGNILSTCRIEEKHLDEIILMFAIGDEEQAINMLVRIPGFLAPGESFNPHNIRMLLEVLTEDEGLLEIAS